LAGFHADENTRWSEEYRQPYTKTNLYIRQNCRLAGMTPGYFAIFRSHAGNNLISRIISTAKDLISETGKKKMAFDVLKNTTNGSTKV